VPACKNNNNIFKYEKKKKNFPKPEILRLTVVRWGKKSFWILKKFFPTFRMPFMNRCWERKKSEISNPLVPQKFNLQFRLHGISSARQAGCTVSRDSAGAYARHLRSDSRTYAAVRDKMVTGEYAKVGKGSEWV
jgi:hypothetical protein